MKCPQCSFICSDLRDLCPKCRLDLRPQKRIIGVKITDPLASYDDLAAKAGIASDPAGAPTSILGRMLGRFQSRASDKTPAASNAGNRTFSPKAASRDRNHQLQVAGKTGEVDFSKIDALSIRRTEELI